MRIKYKRALLSLLSLLLFSLSALLFVNIIKNAIKWKDSLCWPETQGTVLDLQFKEHDQDYTVHVTYSYTVNGVEYIGKNINIGMIKWMISYRQKSWFENNLRIGNHVPVYYNPVLVSEAVLLRGAKGGEFIPIFFAVLLLTGAILTFITVVRRYENDSIDKNSLRENK